jgi:hypothetical protein
MNERLFPAIAPDAIGELRRQLASMTAERDQALADVRLLTLAKDHWRRIAMESDPTLTSKEKNT